MQRPDRRPPACAFSMLNLPLAWLSLSHPKVLRLQLAGSFVQLLLVLATLSFVTSKTTFKFWITSSGETQRA